MGKRKLTILIAILGLLLLSVFVGWMYQARPYKEVFAVKIEGELIGYVEEPGMIEKEINFIENELHNKGYPKINMKENVQTTPERKKDVELFDSQELRSILEDKLTFSTQATAIIIDGKEIMTVQNQAAARSVLEVLKDRYSTQDTQKVSFKEEISYSDRQFSVKLIRTKLEAANYLLDLQKSVSYEVKKGDTIWSIANKNSLSEKDIINVNPSINPELIKPGERIILPGKKALTVITTEKNSSKEKVPFKTESQWNSSLPYGKTKVVRNGSPGLKQVVYEVTFYNGIKVKTNKLSEKIIEEPVNKIIEKGSQRQVSRSGRFIRPTTGPISSYFGPRWGTTHRGIDYAAPYGEVAKASASGTVNYAGWANGYGQVVYIQHRNGLTTRYAHLSKVAVSSGQQVAGGQVIGQVGATGNATGPNLHFEVRKNGIPQNPLNYL